MRYFIQLAYDGTRYCGWQAQDNADTVQQQVELALKYKLKLETKVTGCGRTDSGVHARRFYAHFDAPEDYPNEKLHAFIKEINRFLADDIAVYHIMKVKNNAHARFDAIARTYKYYLNTSKDPFSRYYAWNYRAMLNKADMNSASEMLLHNKDFTSFAKLHTDTKTNLCDVKDAFWEDQNGLLIFKITADRFLRNMVRAIVGTLFDVGRGKISVEQFNQIIAGRNRNLAGKSAPANGLFLDDVKYNWDEILTDPEIKHSAT